MKVILTDDVVGVGDIGEIVRVKPGYARNFLVPRGLAMEVQSSSARSIAHKMKQLDAKKKRMRLAAQSEAEKLAAAAVELGLRVGSGGKVFGSVGGRDIAEKLKALGFDIERRRILLHEPIRKIGEHAVKVKLHADVHAEVKVRVIALAATAEEEERETESARKALEEAAAEKEGSDAGDDEELVEDGEPVSSED